MELRNKIASELGSIMLTAMEQSNARETMQDQQIKLYGMIADCIRSEQVDSKQIADLFMTDAGFSAWYKSKFL